MAISSLKTGTVSPCSLLVGNASASTLFDYLIVAGGGAGGGGDVSNDNGGGESGLCW